MAGRKVFMSNKYEICGEITKLFLNRRDGTELFTLIDTNDLEKVISHPYKWHAYYSPGMKSYYCRSNTHGIKNSTIHLHRYLLDLNNKSEVVDHQNHDTLDNRRSNLKPMIHYENLQNRTRRKESYTGIRNVTWDDVQKKYRVRIGLKGKRIYIGRFEDIKDAEKAAIEAMKKYMINYQEVV